jgi:hypothetical protein
MRTVRYRGLHDDAEAGNGGEAEFVVDSHLELPGLIARIPGPRPPQGRAGAL